MKLIFLLVIVAMSVYVHGQGIRDDGHCGDGYETDNGEPAICEEPYPCCSSAYWCGNGSAWCDCEGCIDYSKCETGWVKNGGSRYCFYAGPKSWEEASTVCSNNGGYLVRIESSAENQFIQSEIVNSWWWTGLNDIADEGTWQYDGSSVTPTYFNWSGHPDNLGNEDCVVVVGSENGKWNDYDCAQGLKFICEAN